MTPGDAQLDHAAALARCARGEPQALRAIYEREAPSMIGVAARIVRRRDLAEEVVQDVFVQIWRKSASFDPRLGSGRSWIYAIVRNRALNVVRDSRREDLVDADTLADLGEESHGHDDVFGRLGDESALRRCLERLEPKRRTSLLLAYVDGFSHGEISGRLGVPLGTVKAWVRRSLLALKECMA
jgi:RNA polymerase sigma-70 factor (ECF subfamily)